MSWKGCEVLFFWSFFFHHNVETISRGQFAFQKLIREEWKACGNECHGEYCQDLSLKDQIFMWITQNSWEGWSQPLSNSAACVGILCTFLGKSWLLSLSQTGCKTTRFSDLLSLFLCSYEVVSWGYMKDILLGDLFIHWQCLRQKDGHGC